MAAVSLPQAPRPRAIRVSGRLPRSERNQQLLDHAEELFTSLGYAAVSMEDIARAAGVSRPIVYEHFESKEGVYIACVERARVSFEKTLARVVELEASPRDQIAMGASALFSTLESDPGRWLLLFGSNAVLPGQHSARLAALRFTTIAQIEFLLRAGNPDAPTATLSACAHAISGVGERLGHWWLSKPELSREDIEHHYCHVVEAIVDQCLGGLGK